MNMNNILRAMQFFSYSECFNLFNTHTFYIVTGWHHTGWQIMDQGYMGQLHLWTSKSWLPTRLFLLAGQLLRGCRAAQKIQTSLCWKFCYWEFQSKGFFLYGNMTKNLMKAAHITDPWGMDGWQRKAMPKQRSSSHIITVIKHFFCYILQDCR